jgi:molecular chaperone GrpE
MPSSPANDEPAADAPAESAELVAVREELAQTQDRYRRALADLDNYRKRAEREGNRRVGEAQRAVLREWLDAVDSVELALRMEPGDPGLTAVLAQMDAILARHGVARLDTVGARFDPERHEAIAVQPADDVPERTVLDVARSGFSVGDGEILRPAQVVVAQRPAGQG